MLASSIPVKIPTPFAAGAGGSYTRQVPIPSQIGITPNAASFTDGFPPMTFQPGGFPDGQDFNGLNNQITAWLRWLQAGGIALTPYDPTFSAEIGGYPSGALIPAASITGSFWLSTVDNNLTDPDTGGADWQPWPSAYIGNWFYSEDTGSANNLVATLSPAPTAYVEGMYLSIKAAFASTGPVQINVNGLGLKNVTTQGLAPLVNGSYTAGAILRLQYDGTQFQLMGTLFVNQVPIRLTGNQTFYFRSDGSDSNNGLTNSPSGAFQTVQGAWNAIFGNYDPAGFTITLQMGIAGTYSGAVFSGYAGPVIISGLSGSPTTSIFNCRAGATISNVFLNQSCAPLTIENCVVLFDYNGAQGLEATVQSQGAPVVIGANVTYSVSHNRTSLAENYAGSSGSTITFDSNVTVTIEGSGHRSTFAETVSGASISAGSSPTNPVVFTTSGTITYTNAFIFADIASNQNWQESTFSSFSMSGASYTVNRNSVLGIGVATLPGSPGSTANGGIAI